MNKQILRIALPAIIANITIPLLGLVDISIAGHLGRTEYIGAMAVGAMMFNLVYWNFAFLRMGTSGQTAQAYGREDTRECAHILVRAVSLAGAIAIAILLFQYPLQWIVLLAVAPSPEVLEWAKRYFFICVWDAPPILIMMAIKGWFLGMQDSTRPMFISIGVNVANIIISLLAVLVFRLGFVGIAIGTLSASYIGLIFALVLLRRYKRVEWKDVNLRMAMKWEHTKGFFKMNSDIFLRSACLMLVTLFFMARGARSGDVTLAVNALIMQLFVLFSYFMDGFAFAGEALVGRFDGSRDYLSLRRVVRVLFLWGVIVSLAFATAYASALAPIFRLLTDNAAVVAAALGYYGWCVAIPIAGVAAFVWDGVFIGLTATRQMLLAVVMAVSVFFIIYYFPVGRADNNRLWLAFISYLAMRGVMQTVLYARMRRATA